MALWQLPPPPSNQRVTWQYLQATGFLRLSPFLLLFLAFSLSLPSHPFLGVVLLLEKEAPAFASSITKKRKIKNTIEKSPTVILEVRKEVKESGFSVPLGGILASKGVQVRNDKILILRPGVDILGLSSPRFVSHFIPHSVHPILILFPISSFLWLLLFQFIFTYEESINHLTLSDIKPFQILFGQSKTQIYKPSMSQMPPLGFWDLGQVTQDNRSPLPSRQGAALSCLPSHLSVGQCHPRCVS